MTSDLRYRTILMFGEPGSGKGTHGKAIGGLPGFFHLSCGDVFRRINPTSELGQVFLRYSSQGLLVPDEITVRLWSEHIHNLARTNHFHPEEQILILDGIPRNRHQARMMEEHILVLGVIALEASNEDVLIARIRRRALHDNRLDDANEPVIRRRFQEYQQESAPVLQFYSPGLIHKVDATGQPIEVLAAVIAVIQETLKDAGLAAAQA